ncbi:hypothetical protein ABXM67_10560 [Enterococcus faecium]|uniref:hypothetical protein n=1 Tax=Enterococcus faecium TaxID=1352 RepID=UPI001387194F|nr:hypothetical protein [Enterococcus faecium]MDK4435106.1 hypothetical protein [Enterococcus faecium]
MKSSRHDLRKLIEKYIEEELTDFLEYNVNRNDVNGILENAIDDVDERIGEYIEFINNN